MAWLSQKEVAALTGFSESALRHWRKGQKMWDPTLCGPAFFSVHGRIYYSSASVKLWMRSHAALSGIIGLEASELLPVR